MQQTRHVDEKARRQAAIASLIVSVLVLSLKAAAYVKSGSSAVLSDALESIVNVLTAGVALFVIHFASQPADLDHPYGHGKAEYFSAAFEGGLIFFAAVAILLESTRSLWFGVNLRDIGEGIVLTTLATVLNLSAALYLRWVGRRQRSEALQASSAHLLSDVKTTVGVVIGLFLVNATGLTWIDPVVALIVASWLAFEGYSIARRSVGALIDETDEVSLSKLAEAIRRHRRIGVIDIHLMRSIRAGSFHHIDAHLVVPEFWDVLRAHEVAHGFEANVMEDYPYDAEFAFHLDPCRSKFCPVCAVESCPIRRKPFVANPEFAVKDLLGPAREM